MQHKDKKQEMLVWEPKKTVKDVKKNKMMREKWEMKTPLHLIKHIIRIHSKRD